MPRHRGGSGRGAHASRGNTRCNNSRTGSATFQIAGGIFSRLKIPCPEILTAERLSQKGYQSSTVPITFRALPAYLQAICNEMSLIKSRTRYLESDSDSDYKDELDPNDKNNKAVLIKGGLILAEMKVYYAQRGYYQLKNLEYSYDKLHELCQMAMFLPKPLMEYLDCIGTVSAGHCREVTPVLAQCGADAADSGALTLAPSQLAPLLARLRRGVRAGAPEDARAALAPLGLQWEPLAEPADRVRLTDESFRFWTTNSGTAEAPRYTIRWDDEDSRLFQRIISSVRGCKGGKDFIVEANLSSGIGSPAQFVQTPEWRLCDLVNWFTMTDVDDEFISKGAFFGFGSFDSKQVQPSRFTGTLENSYRSGEARSFGYNIMNEWKIPRTDPQFGTVIPVTFSTLPIHIEYIWGGIRRPPYDSAAHKAVFIKAGLILAEAKVYFAQMESSTTIHPGQQLIYSYEQVSLLKRMPKWLPKPLAVYLECLGNTRAGACGQEVTPVLAQCGADAADSGALTLAPSQLAPLLARLRRGVRAGAPEDARAALAPLGLQWEPLAEPADRVRLTDESFRFWTTNSGTAEAPRYTIRWDDEDSKLFEATIRSIPGRKDLLMTNLLRGQGSPAQLVQFATTRNDGERWFAMTDIDECSIQLGAAFRFCDYAGKQVQQSRFTGSLETAYISGFLSSRTLQEINAVFRMEYTY